MTYRLTLTGDDLRTIGFVGSRYAWSDALWRLCNEGENDLAEHEAWTLREAFDADTVGGHGLFPMLDGNSELSRKLLHLWDTIV